MTSLCIAASTDFQWYDDAACCSHYCFEITLFLQDENIHIANQLEREGPGDTIDYSQTNQEANVLLTNSTDTA